MDYIRIGMVSKPRGIRGEVKVIPLTDDIKRFSDLEYVFVEDGKSYRRLNVKGTRFGDGCAFLFLETVYTCDEAEKLRGKYICVDREHAVKLPEDRYFIFDLEGCRVVTDEGKELGEITEVMQPGANDVYVVSDGKNEVLIPAVKSFVLDVDIEHKTVTVKESMLQEVAVYED